MKTIIKTEQENKVALAFIERLMEGDPEKDSKEGQLLSLLSDEIQVFEKRYNSTPTSPVEDEWEKDIRYRFYAHFKGGIRTGEDSEVADWWISEVSQKNRIPGEWEKEFDKLVPPVGTFDEFRCYNSVLKHFVDMGTSEPTSTMMETAVMEQNYYSIKRNRSKLKSFIRSAISRARKEERERVVKMIEGIINRARYSNVSVEGPYRKGWRSALTALSDKLK